MYFIFLQRSSFLFRIFCVRQGAVRRGRENWNNFYITEHDVKYFPFCYFSHASKFASLSYSGKKLTCMLFIQLFMFSLRLHSFLNPPHYFMPKAGANYTRRDYHYFHFSYPFVRPCHRRLRLLLKQVLRESWDFNDFEFNPSLYPCSRWLLYLKDSR